jgi:hypothetical protein
LGFHDDEIVTNPNQALLPKRVAHLQKGWGAAAHGDERERSALFPEADAMHHQVGTTWSQCQLWFRKRGRTGSRLDGDETVRLMGALGIARGQAKDNHQETGPARCEAHRKMMLTDPRSVVAAF